MSKINFGWKILDMLKCKRNCNYIRWFSAVLKEEIRNESISFTENLIDIKEITVFSGDLIR